MSRPSGQWHPQRGRPLVLAALGIVLSDIGTSPLYAVQTIFERGAIRPVAIDQDSI